MSEQISQPIVMSWKVIVMVAVLMVVLSIILGTASDLFSSQSSKVALDDLWRQLKRESGAVSGFDMPVRYLMFQIYGDSTSCSDDILSELPSSFSEDYSDTCRGRNCVCISKIKEGYIPDVQYNPVELDPSWQGDPEDMGSTGDVLYAQSHDVIVYSYVSNDRDMGETRMGEIGSENCLDVLGEAETHFDSLYCRPLKSGDYVQKPTLGSSGRIVNDSYMLFIYSEYGIEADEIIAENTDGSAIDLMFRFETFGSGST